MSEHGNSGQSSNGGMNWLGNPFVCGLVGFCAAMIFCEVTWVRPLRATLDAREKSLHEWAQINSQERQTIASIKTTSAEELKKWVAIVNEQNTRFAQIQSKLHQQQIELTGPATSYIIIAAVVIIAVIALVVFWLRDANAGAATTLENVAALAPDTMMRSVLIASLANREPITLLVNEKEKPAALPGPKSEC